MLKGKTRKKNQSKKSTTKKDMKWHYKKTWKKSRISILNFEKIINLKNNINKPSQPELIFKICDSGHEINTNHMEKKSKKNHKSKSLFNKYW